MTQQTTALEFDNIFYSLPQRDLLAGFSLSLTPADKVIIRGESGGGKSTLLKIACGLIAPTSGAVIIHGQTLSMHNLLQLRSKISYVQQQSPLSEDTVAEFLQLPFSYKINNHLIYNEKIALELSEQFRLKENILQCRPQDLSGGERQRVAIIGGLLLERNILLLDEPCAGLDAKSAESVIAYLRSREDLTILAIAHDNHTLELSDNIVELESHALESV